MQQGLGRERSLIRVVVVASSGVMQAGLETLFAADSDLEVVGRAASLADLMISAPVQADGADRLLDGSSDFLPEVALSDVTADAMLDGSVDDSAADVIVAYWQTLQIDRLPLWNDTDDLSFQRHNVQLNNPAILLLVEDWQPEAIAPSLQLGVRGILPIEVTSSEMIATIQAVAIGLTVLHPDITASLLTHLPASTRSPVDPIPALTSREIEVLSMLAEGLGNKAIARRLTLSEHTVKFHISSIFSKLGVSSRTEAVIVGARQGLILL